MSILKIPGYFYFGTETIQSSFNLYKSSKLEERLREGISYTVTGAALNDISNPRVFVNNYLGEDVLSPEKENCNIAFLSGESMPVWVQKLCDNLQIAPITRMQPANNTNTPTKFVTLNTFELAPGSYINCGKKIDNQDYYIRLSSFDRDYVRFIDQGTNFSITYIINVHSDDLFVNNVINPDLSGQVYALTVSFLYNTDLKTLQSITINRASYYTYDYLKTAFNNFSLNGTGAEDKDTDNPYNTDPDENPGGDGDHNPPITEPTDVPNLPSISAASLGLISIYTPSEAQLQALASYLWSGAFDPDTFKKLFGDPMDAIIGLGIVPIVPSSAGTKNVRFGNVDSGIAMSYVTTQWASKDCGSVKISKDVGSFLDYDATKISIYLPFIGFRDLSPDDVMGGTIKVVYNIDILTGSCSAFIKHSTRGVLYNYNGNCIMNIPLSAANYSGAIQNAVSTVASGAGVLAGMMSGAAPVTAMSAVSMIQSAANTAFSSKPNIQRTGNLGGAAGLLSVKTPFLVIQRPNVSVPEYVQNYVGQTANKTASLGSCSGFTMVAYCHIDGISATPGEISEIETLLKQGVIL